MLRIISSLKLERTIHWWFEQFSKGLWTHTKVDLRGNQIATIDGGILHRILNEFSQGDGFLNLEECGRIGNTIAKPQRLVRGGKAAAPGAWPWQVAIYDAQVEYIICGGALIGKGGSKYIFDPRWSNVPRCLQVIQIFVHDEYTGFESDIALMKLHGSANLTKRVQLICLPSNDDLSDDFLDGSQDEFGGPHRGWVAGWGKDASDEGTDALTEVQLTVTPKRECRNRIRMKTSDHPASITRNTFCAGERNNASSFVNEDAKEYGTVCEGDSGSPMVFPSHSLLKSQWVVEGIVSHIYVKSRQDCSNYEPGQYGVFTRVNK
ncbi:unnamed protein product [Darwinula stevensoni]|uniref:Peptidase S1 domain-containing protein n=1 Tax=Darwinula stevensoni TaxID=69355 RepID=A0A7R9FPA2_9CRUS|nr:unnamed protein product [Darwinula stevensoni]CAG0897343.1 unnamed protein product [Darwinula stevensoni]